MAASSASSSSSSSSDMMSTNTLLAVPDGPIASGSADLKNHAVSYIGGYPTFPSFPSSSSSSEPPASVLCSSCNLPLPLLAQVYCPPEGGENDRTIYVFGCFRSGCGRKDGSLRAFRASVRNEEYVKDVLETKKRKEVEEQAAREREKAIGNPFSVKSGLAGGGLGGAIFGSAAVGVATGPTFNPFSASAAAAPSTQPSPIPMFSALALASSEPVAGPSTPALTYAPPLPAYQPPQYLSTFEEYIPRPVPGKSAASLREEDDGGDKKGRKAELAAMAAAKNQSSGGGAVEQWERVLPKGVDEVFERFVNRLVGAEGGDDQVLRYDLGAVPLPYTSRSALYQKIFPKNSSPAVTSLANSNDDPDSDDEESNDLVRRYDPSRIPPCPRCHSERVFELQLVPGLISVLKPEILTTRGQARKKGKGKKDKAQTKEERKKEIEALLRGTATERLEEEDGGDGEGGLEVNLAGMEWGTVMVFGCKGDCVGFGEEWVGVEWEDLTA